MKVDSSEPRNAISTSSIEGYLANEDFANTLAQASFLTGGGRPPVDVQPSSKTPSTPEGGPLDVIRLFLKVLTQGKGIHEENRSREAFANELKSAVQTLENAPPDSHIEVTVVRANTPPYAFQFAHSSDVRPNDRLSSEPGEMIGSANPTNEAFTFVVHNSETASPATHLPALTLDQAKEEAELLRR